MTDTRAAAEQIVNTWQKGSLAHAVRVDWGQLIADVEHTLQQARQDVLGEIYTKSNEIRKELVDDSVPELHYSHFMDWLSRLCPSMTRAHRKGGEEMTSYYVYPDYLWTEPDGECVEVVKAEDHAQLVALVKEWADAYQAYMADRDGMDSEFYSRWEKARDALLSARRGME